MNQSVPSWRIDDPQPDASSKFSGHLFNPPTAPINPLGLRMDYEVAELTWENGQLVLHDLVPPRPAKPSPCTNPSAWNKHHQLAGGTLESVVNYATGAAAVAGDELEDNWLGGVRRSVSPLAIDAVVPCQDEATDSQIGDREDKRRCELMAGVCSSQGSAPGSVTVGRVENTTLVTLGTCMEENVGLMVTAATGTATKSALPETDKTSLGKRKAISLEDHVSISHTSSQKTEKGARIVTEVDKPSTSGKESSATAVHNQSERKRRDRINQRMNTLQKLVPNSSKTDKASMLDEAIEYLKQLQAQVQTMMMNNYMRTLAVQQRQMPAMMAHMAHLAHLAHSAHFSQMGMGAGMMNLANSVGQSMPPTLPLLHPSAFNALAARDWNGYPRPDGGVDLCAALLAHQMAQQQMGLDEYNRMAAQFQQQPPPPEPNPKIYQDW